LEPCVHGTIVNVFGTTGSDKIAPPMYESQKKAGCEAPDNQKKRRKEMPDAELRAVGPERQPGATLGQWWWEGASDPFPKSSVVTGKLKDMEGICKFARNRERNRNVEEWARCHTSLVAVRARGMGHFKVYSGEHDGITKPVVHSVKNVESNIRTINEGRGNLTTGELSENCWHKSSVRADTLPLSDNVKEGSMDKIRVILEKKLRGFGCESRHHKRHEHTKGNK